jgi:hypothetical protein
VTREMNVESFVLERRGGGAIIKEDEIDEIMTT